MPHRNVGCDLRFVFAMHLVIDGALASGQSRFIATTEREPPSGRPGRTPNAFNGKSRWCGWANARSIITEFVVRSPNRSAMDTDGWAMSRPAWAIDSGRHRKLPEDPSCLHISSDQNPGGQFTAEPVVAAMSGAGRALATGVTQPERTKRSAAHQRRQNGLVGR